MQYFHMAFQTAVTSPEASDMPEKNVHGTKRKFKKKVKKKTNKKNTTTTATPLK